MSPSPGLLLPFPVLQQAVKRGESYSHVEGEGREYYECPDHEIPSFSLDNLGLQQVCLVMKAIQS